MQSKVIDDILTVEDDAEKIVEDAQNESRSILSDAHEKASKIISSALDSVREQGRRDVDAAQRLLDSHLDDYEREKIKLQTDVAKMDSVALDRAVDRIIARICSTGIDG